MSRASWRAWEARHREEIAARTWAGARPPFDDLELSAWTVSLLRAHLSPDQFARMRGVLLARLAAPRRTA